MAQRSIEIGKVKKPSILEKTRQRSIVKFLNAVPIWAVPIWIFQLFRCGVEALTLKPIWGWRHSYCIIFAG